MIELLTGFPADVVAYGCHGRLTRADYELVLRDIEDRLEAQPTLRMYCEFGADYAGSDADASWEDWKSSFSTWFHWERGAIVTDVEWMIAATRFFGLLFPGQWRAFLTTDAEAARRWVAEGRG